MMCSIKDKIDRRKTAAAEYKYGRRPVYSTQQRFGCCGRSTGLGLRQMPRYFYGFEL
jgi:hypothetical protein